ncbi:MAG: Abortive infection protein [Myxococcaceae bacterium]|nr:Abortive infection protein [Myxococcaceae bacterium]
MRILSASPPVRTSIPRVLRAVAFVAVWVLAGVVLRVGHFSWASPDTYIVIGLPLTMAYQRLLRRRPLYELWVRNHRSTGRGWLLPVLLGVTASLMHVINLRSSLGEHNPTDIAFDVAAMAGAIGCGLAANAMDARDWRALGFGFATAGLASVLISVATSHRQSWDLSVMAARILRSTVYYVPVGFTLEEVTFRAAIDDDLADDRRYMRYLTAVASSGLWGLWHLPIHFGKLNFGTLFVIVAVHVIVGTPLALSYRRSGNLLVPAIVHAFADGVRDALS